MEKTDMLANIEKNRSPESRARVMTAITVSEV